ncbi:MAG: hypothetical protein SAJ12_11230 [Jaaginema sp. PMC 1079.18]|nr:hypothetical protein [Jaaginema sp. PMC 1080.18]MEC4851575.1 hypothetical protein [Jaaginema sp. PMC 1079.18]MEC4867316.1 hypothetical protein [Jaaginema sp. PMC 1078.18]
MVNSSLDRAQIQELGASLRQIDRKITTPEISLGIARVWYQGGEPYFDVSVNLRDGEVEWFQFTLRGRALSWNRQANPSKITESPWQTGQTSELQTEGITLYPASTLVTSDRALNYDFLAVAYNILATRPDDPILRKITDICHCLLNQETEN